MRRLLRTLSACAIVLVGSIGQFAQSAPVVDDGDIQMWNDVNVTIALNKKVDIYVPFTIRLYRDVQRVSEARVGSGFVFHVNKAIAITPFYTFIRYRNAAGQFRTENRLNGRFVYKFPTKGFALSHRSQYEYRFRPTGNLWRYRAAITIEKPLPKKWVHGVKLFATEEPFYESNSGRFSRNRISFGVNKDLSAKVSVAVYYLHQGDNFSHPSSINVIGTNWKVNL